MGGTKKSSFFLSVRFFKTGTQEEQNKPNKAWAEQYNSHFELAMRFIDASMQDKKYRLAETARRRNLTRAVVAAFLIALSGLTIWAYFERDKSEKNEILALSEKQK